MNEIQVAKINEVSIICLEEDRGKLIPIRPICDGLGISVQKQLEKIKEDEDLSSTVTLRVMVAADGKDREMACLPIEFIFGWLFTINPKNVKPESQNAVRQYRLQCYKALYEYFTEPQTFLAQKQELMEQQVEIYQEKQANFKNARKEMDEAKKALNAVMAVTIDEWRQNKRQFQIPFSTDETVNPTQAITA